MVNVEEEEEKLLVQLHLESTKKGRHLLSVRAYQVVDFSSQYGSEESMSYTADNFLGPPTIYPRAGDHAYSFQLRTYGHWWLNLPSYTKTSVNLPVNSSVESQDFIEFRVEQQIVPVLIRIYEIYNPGAIVKILSYCYDTERWVILWQGNAQVLTPSSSHCFTVVFEDVHHLSDYYRIEFHHKHLKYFCELDGIIIYGEDKFPAYFSSYNPNCPKILMKKTVQNYIIDNSKAEHGRINPNSKGYFDILPQEVITAIMSYLDLQSLCNASIVSRSFKKACYDPVLYKELNLQIYWHMVDVSTLKGLHSRLLALKHLNLSWCGGQGRITPTYFTEFLETRCQFLCVLKISCCSFINNNCMKAIANCCQNLEVLEMRCCHSKDLTQSGFKYISLMLKLTYLDLYRTRIDTSSMLTIIRNCSNLEHIFLGSCVNIDTFDEVARAIARNLRFIKTLDFWRGVSLTCIGVNELAEYCHNLIELDVGWCYKIDATCGCLRLLISHNPKLKKLFLSAIRTVSNNELNTVANYCKDLEQLDILGTREVDLITTTRVLESCPKLKLLDVSYCDTSVKTAVSVLQENFPSVEIKCSIPPEMNYQ